MRSNIFGINAESFDTAHPAALNDNCIHPRNPAVTRSSKETQGPYSSSSHVCAVNAPRALVSFVSEVPTVQDAGVWSSKGYVTVHVGAMLHRAALVWSKSCAHSVNRPSCHPSRTINTAHVVHCCSYNWSSRVTQTPLLRRFMRACAREVDTPLYFA